MRKRQKTTPRIIPTFILLVVMLSIGAFTLFAGANTYEVVTKKDIPFSSVIQPLQLTSNDTYDKELVSKFNQSFNGGVFGIPKKIKFSETKQHIDIISANRGNAGWVASEGLAHTFLIDNPEQKIFGEAIIYLRINTPTTQHLGDVLTGDVINIVTTEGWQLGYRVQQTALDPSNIDPSINTTKSTILVVMVDDKSGAIKAFSASLAKVGERV